VAHTATPIPAIVVYPLPAGAAPADGVAAASTVAVRALPTAKPTYRSTWLRLIALPVSEEGTAETTSAGNAANEAPTPRPATAITTNSCHRSDRASPNRTNAPPCTRAATGRTRC
jgi:hypothetical protein